MYPYKTSISYDDDDDDTIRYDMIEYCISNFVSSLYERTIQYRRGASSPVRWGLTCTRLLNKSEPPAERDENYRECFEIQYIFSGEEANGDGDDVDKTIPPLLPRSFKLSARVVSGFAGCRWSYQTVSLSLSPRLSPAGVSLLFPPTKCHPAKS